MQSLNEVEKWEENYLVLKAFEHQKRAVFCIGKNMNEVK